MSLSYVGTQEIRQLDPDATVGFLSNVSIGKLTDTNVDFLAVSSRAATRSLIGSAHDAGMLVYVWTVNTPREMALFIDRGVDGIITDVPQLLNDVMAELNDASLAERLLLRFSNEIGLELGESEQ
jgi:glycerophosphoryl diester phosphodiesterase